MLKLGLMIFGLGMLILILSNSKYSIEPKDTKKLGIIIIIFGIILIISSIEKTGRLGFSIIGISFGGFMVNIGLDEIKRIIKCNEEVDGKLYGFIESKGRSSLYYPILTYRYKERRYNIKAQNSMYSGEKEKYEKIENHIIYINPENPTQMLYSRKPSIYMYTGFLMGIIFLILGIKVLLSFVF